MVYHMHIHLYFNPDDIQNFKNGKITEIYGFTKDIKDTSDSVQLSIPLGLITESGYGCYKIERTDFEGEF